MRSWTPIAVLLCGLLCASCANTDAAFGKNGPYAGAQFGFTFEQFDDPSPIDVEDDSSTSYGLKAGYRIDPNVAAEVAFEYLDEYEFEVVGLSVADLDAWTLCAQAKLYPIQGQVQPYGLVGLGIMDAELTDNLGLGVRENETEAVFKLGLGADAYVNEQVGFYGEGVYSLPTGDLDDFQYISLNLGIFVAF